VISPYNDFILKPFQPIPLLFKYLSTRSLKGTLEEEGTGEKSRSQRRSGSSRQNTPKRGERSKSRER
jgi:hypothetical protein